LRGTDRRYIPKGHVPRMTPARSWVSDSARGCLTLPWVSDSALLPLLPLVGVWLCPSGSAPGSALRYLGPMPQAPPAKINLGARQAQRLLIPSEVDLDVACFLLQPAGEVRGVIVALGDRGKETLASDVVVQTALSRGWAICGVDPRGIGELATDKMGWVFAVSLLLGENFVGRLAWDLERVFECLGSAGRFHDKPIGLYARGANACLAATYAIGRGAERAGPAARLRWYLLRDGYVSYRAFIDRPRSLSRSYRLMPEDRDRMTAFDREIPAVFFAFDALRGFELPQLLAGSTARGLIVNPADGDGGGLPERSTAGMLPTRVRSLWADEPAPRIMELLDAVIGKTTGDDSMR
jgi:hypothetical protein